MKCSAYKLLQPQLSLLPGLAAVACCLLCSHPHFYAIHPCLPCSQAGPPAMAAAAPAPAAGAQPAARPPAPVHKSTAIIPGWSRPLSSQALTIECQKITQPTRSASPKECFGVMELEVMKFVAYCGGLTIRLRIDDLQHGPVDR